MFELTREKGEQILLGGWFLGGGGGGLPEGGREILDLVLKTGTVRFVSLEELEEDDLLVTASLVGSPASPDSCLQERHYQQVYDSFLTADDRLPSGFFSGLFSSAIHPPSLHVCCKAGKRLCQTFIFIARPQHLKES